MSETTKDQFVSAATKLLDKGGPTAVTIRAVADAVGLSHNAPYRHFRGRNSLLAAVATRDFIQLTRVFEDQAGKTAETALRNAVKAYLDYAMEHTARYRLMYSEPVPFSPEPDLGEAASASFEAFSRIVSRCQDEGVLPQADTTRLTRLINAALHGAVDLELSGRTGRSRGVRDTSNLFFQLLKNVRL